MQLFSHGTDHAPQFCPSGSFARHSAALWGLPEASAPVGGKHDQILKPHRPVKIEILQAAAGSAWAPGREQRHQIVEADDTVAVEVSTPLVFVGGAGNPGALSAPA